MEDVLLSILSSMFVQNSEPETSLVTIDQNVCKGFSHNASGEFTELA